MRGFLLASALVFFLGPLNSALAAERQITTTETNALVQAAFDVVWPKATKLPGFGFEREVKRNPYYPRFRFFDGTWAGTPEGSVVIGFVALDPLTADVWNGTVCEELRSPQVAAIQRKIRRRIGLSDRQYRRLKAPGPEC
jgi:hypothetical protein